MPCRNIFAIRAFKFDQRPSTCSLTRSLLVVLLLCNSVWGYHPMRPFSLRLVRQASLHRSGYRFRASPADSLSRHFFGEHSTGRPLAHCAHSIICETTTRLHSTSSYAVPAMTETELANRTYTPYERWVRRLYQTNLFHPVKLGLQNIQQLHELLGSPLDSPDVTVIHIAGTNGKGSVALKIARTLELSDPSLRVGLFCSPHVSSFRERMQLNGEMISEEHVVEYLPHIYDLCQKHDIPATFFEITTALACLFYQRQRADVIVLETGLGGRLDATNVVKAPALSVITSIGLEHTRILGDTIEKIALEKGGIIKAGHPVLVGPNVPHDVLRKCANEKKAESYYTCDDVLGVSSVLVTDYDQENARTAEAAIKLIPKYKDIPADVLRKGTSQRPTCRFEMFQVDNVTGILDVAHNPPAMEYLMRKLQVTFPDKNYRVVVGMSSDKDLGQCGRMILNTVHDVAGSIHLVQAAHPRAATLEAMLSAEPTLQNSHFDTKDRAISTQIHLAVDLAKKNDEVLVVCGSVFLMAEAREALGFDEPRDSDYIAEMAGAGVKHGQENFGNSADPEPNQRQMNA